MRSYNAKVSSSVKMFNEFPIVLRTSVPVHPNTKLIWIEEICEDAELEEQQWYATVVRNNLMKEEE